MKRIIFSMIAVFVTVVTLAQPPAGKANIGDSYGEKTSRKGAITIAELSNKLKGTDSLNTKVLVKVVEVCPKKGCWLKVQVDETTTALVQMKDYGFFLPTAIKGKTIVLDGLAKMQTTSVEELQHYAEDAKKSKEEIDAITEPKTELRFIAKGILVAE